MLHFFILLCCFSLVQAQEASVVCKNDMDKRVSKVLKFSFAKEKGSLALYVTNIGEKALVILKEPSSLSYKSTYADQSMDDEGGIRTMSDIIGHDHIIIQPSKLGVANSKRRIYVDLLYKEQKETTLTKETTLQMGWFDYKSGKYHRFMILIKVDNRLPNKP